MKIRVPMTALLVVTFLVPASAKAGTLWGRIIGENGRPLAEVTLTIDGKTVRTSKSGSYEVNLRDGERPLPVQLSGRSFTTDPIRISSPRTKANWRVEADGERLRRLR